VIIPETESTNMAFEIPVVREIVDPRSGRPAATKTQRELVLASLLRVP
jgi:hypothetical protein